MNKTSQEIYDILLSKIRNKNYLPGDKLPSIRYQASFFNVKKYYVESAYEKLRIQGYVKSIAGKGYFVISNQGRYMSDVDNVPQSTDTIVPMLQIFYKNDSYRKLTDSLLLRGLKNTYNLNLDSLYYSSSGIGMPRLREEISKYLSKLYGHYIHPDRILISSSKKDLVDYLLNEFNKKYILLEEYNKTSGSDLFQAYRSQIRYIKMDEGGVKVDDLPKKPSLLFIESHNQLPTCINYSPQRINELEKFCLQNDIFIIDDLYNRQFIFEHKDFLYNKRNLFLIDDLAAVFPRSIKFAYMVVPTNFEATNYKSSASSLTENFVLSLFEDESFYQITDKIWFLLNDVRDRFILELNKRNIKFYEPMSGPYISVIIDGKLKVRQIKKQIKLTPFEINGQFFKTSDGLDAVSFKYINIKLDKVGEFIDFLFFNKLSLN